MTNKKKLTLALAAIFAVNILIICLAQASVSANYKKGSTGSVVSQIQERLSWAGYYNGSIDGVFGSRTEEAVKKYQKAKGLKADGIVGSRTLAMLGISGGAGSAASSSSGDINLLAQLISAEARGEPYNGQVAVGAVVLNRMRHPSFPNTMSGVIYQPGAFSCLDDGQFWQPIASSCYQAARDALNGSDPSGGAIYYFNPSTATNKWIWSRPLIVQIGKHRFCS